MGSLSYSYSNGIVSSILPRYKDTKEVILDQKITFETEVNKALAAIPEGVSNAEKVLAANDYIVYTAEYDTAYQNYSAYDIFVNKTHFPKNDQPPVKYLHIA